MCLNLIVTFNLIKIYFLLHSSAHKQLIKSIYPIWKDEIFRVLQSDENPFANDGLHRRRHDHRRHADHGDIEHHHGRRNREDPDSIARVKLSIPKFTRREDADAYLEWAEQCDQIFRVHNLSDQRRVNLASVEFSGYALTLWNQI